ncbi:hypothetical protein AAFF_G00357720 [Aldrovandia affinis]|uniref:SEA domain-containing protein n=1 Tax=Aldrovandia affinis TaxID=143900 RepID=A0AAD7T8P6_9TELE|nr:hypothetical protein AAFF_G00357720 [Aldrovandia affinis]
MTTISSTTRLDKNTLTLPHSLYTVKPTIVSLATISTVRTDSQTTKPSSTSLKISAGTTLQILSNTPLSITHPTTSTMLKMNSHITNAQMVTTKLHPTNISTTTTTQLNTIIEPTTKIAVTMPNTVGTESNSSTTFQQSSTFLSLHETGTELNQTTMTVTSAAANLKIKTILLQFSLQEEFTSDLLDQHSEKYIQLAKNITTEINKIYSKAFSIIFFGSIVKGFRKGSVATDTDLLFKEKVSENESVSPSEVLKILQNFVSNYNSFPLNIIPTSIHVFEEMLVSVNLSLVLSFSPSLNDSFSPYYREISSSLHHWLETVFSKFYGNESVSSLTKFRNIDGWVGVTIGLKYNVERRTADAILTAAVLSSQCPFLYLKHVLSVNGFQAPVDFFPLTLRITSLSFTEDLVDRGSDIFLLYSTVIRTSVTKLYKDKEGFSDVYVTKMTSGSVIVELVIIFEKMGISSSSVSQVLQSGLPQLELSGLTADPNSLQTELQPLTSPRPFPGYAVAIIVMCGFAIILFPIAVVAGCKTGMWEKLKRSFSSSSQHYNIAAAHNAI